MDASALAVAAAGILGPYIKAFITRFVGLDPDGGKAAAYNAGFSFVLALICIWLTGGFGSAHVPPFTLSNPSPLIGFIWPYWTAVYTLSSLVGKTTQTYVDKAANKPPAVEVSAPPA